MNLVVDGSVVRTDTGNGTDTLILRQWDVADLRGKTARIEVRDEITAGPRGYILVDDIVLTPAAPGL
ncbi:MAG: hypothetical protein V4671_32140 [Armatimonadota bacterium]